MKLLSTFSIISILVFFSLTGGKIGFQSPDAQESYSDNTDLLFYCRPSLESEMEGKTFLDSAWQESIIRTETNKTFQVKTRYRVVSDDFQVLYNEASYTLLSNHIDVVEMGDMVFIPGTFIKDDRDMEGYLQLLTDGKTKLYQRFRKEGSDKGIKTHFYVARKDETPRPLDTRKKMVVRYLKDKKVPMYNYIQVHKLKTDNAADLKQIFDYYNSL